MAGFLLSESHEFETTGIVNPVFEWARNSDGSSKRSDVQSVNDKGVKLWDVGVTWIEEGAEGRQTEVLGDVRVASLEKPEPKRHKITRFKNCLYVASSRIVGNRAVTVHRFTADSWAQAGSNPTANHPQATQKEQS